MKVLFMDTSALMKRYIPGKTGSFWTRSQCQPENMIVLSQATLVEAVASICRKARDPNPIQRITQEERDRLITLFRKESRERYYIVSVTKYIYNRAGDLCRFHQLRAYDAVQLVCALEMRVRQVEAGLPAPIFVSADNRLLEVAAAEGFAVDNPNNHSGV